MGWSKTVFGRGSDEIDQNRFGIPFAPCTSSRQCQNRFGATATREPLWGSRGHLAATQRRGGCPEAVMAEEEEPHDFKADFYEKCREYLKDAKYSHHFTREHVGH